jgi:hypothetical protein
VYWYHYYEEHGRYIRRPVLLRIDGYKMGKDGWQSSRHLEVLCFYVHHFCARLIVILSLSCCYLPLLWDQVDTGRIMYSHSFSSYSPLHKHQKYCTIDGRILSKNFSFRLQRCCMGGNLFSGLRSAWGSLDLI